MAVIEVSRQILAAAKYRCFEGIVCLWCVNVPISRKLGRAGTTVANLNVEHYRKLLADEIDETRRQMITRLLAEEEAKLKALENPTKKRKTHC